MQRRAAVSMLFFGSLCPAVIIDRIAIVVGNAIVKDSDILRDLKVTSFLNAEPLKEDAAARKKAANRLIDQVFIRREIRIGDYPPATPDEANEQLDALRRQRFKTDAALNDALRRYGLTPLDLKTQFAWQLTVLRFIDLRFKPAVLVTDAEIERYYKEHQPQLRRQHPGNSSLDDVREEIRDTLTGERVNRLFFAWLDDQRKNTKIEYREENLA
jgi:hypothetical protein